MNGPVVQAPIVLVHGILGFDSVRLGELSLDYFRGIPEKLGQLGNTVPKPPALSPTGSVAARAAQLAVYLEDTVPPGPIHLIAHSMGGLDSVYMITQLETNHRVLSLTTLGTPFTGTPVADLGDAVFLPVLKTLGVAGLDVRGFLDLMRRNASELRDEALESDNLKSVKCYCLAGRYQPRRLPPDLLAFTHDMIQGKEGDNDGLVSVVSATAFGQPLPSWPADHFRLINWPTNLVNLGEERDDPSIIDGYIGLIQNLVDNRVEKDL